MRGNEERVEATRRGFICRGAISLSNFVSESQPAAKHVVIRSSKVMRKFRYEHLNI